MKSLLMLLLLPPALMLLIASRHTGRVPRLLRAALPRRALRLAATFLVLLGVAREAPAQEGESGLEEPAARVEVKTPVRESIARWHALVRDRSFARARRFILEALNRPRGLIATADQAIPIEDLPGAFPDGFAALLRQELAITLDGGRPAPIASADLRNAVTELDEGGFWFPIVDALLFRMQARLDRSATIEDRLALMRALAEHRRLSEAFILARARVQPIDIGPRAWASKAGPSRQIQAAEERARVALREQLEDVLRSSPIAADGEGSTSFSCVSEGMELFSSGRGAKVLPKGALFDFGRHDLLRARGPCVLRHAWLGRIELAEGELIDVFDLPDLLSGDQRELVREAIARALAGDQVAQGLIELSLPLTHRSLAASLAQRPEGEGLDALRMILRLFDDLVPHESLDFEIGRFKLAEPEEAKD